MKYFHLFWFGINVVTQLLAQSLTPIPFDWSGQNGISSYDGLLLWNRDWNSNELFFDGTFQSYPQRFGEEIAQDATLSYTYAFRNILFPDSSKIYTSFDYRQGDYLYDQLNIHADFSQSDRIMKWNGFKRSYGGPFSQFIQPENQSTRVLTPNQQSYLFYYLSKMNNRISVLSIGKFITDSGILYFSADPNTGELYEVKGLHKDEITTSSFSVYTEWKQFDFHFRIAQYMENRDWNTSESFRPKHYFIRGLYEGILSPSGENVGSLWQVGMSGHTQALTFPSAVISKDRSWISAWGNLNRSKFQIYGGVDAGDESVLPHFLITLNKNSGSMKWKNEMGMKNIPKHLMIWENSQSFFESWINVNSNVKWNKEDLTIFGIINYWHVNNLIEDGMGISPKELFSIKTGYGWEAIHGLKFSGSWRHSSTTPLLSDGISDHIKTELEYTRSLFSDKMILTAELIVEGLLNRDSSSIFHPELQRPMEWSFLLEDYWTTHFVISAKVSSVVFSYRMQNLFNIQKNMFKQLYPDLPEEWIWPRNNAYFLPMGQLVSFGVEWEFED